MYILFNLVKKILIIISSLILAVLAIIIIMSIFARFIGISLYWYDEVSSILLAWLTFYGAALCALNRNHMGFGNLIISMPYHIKKYIFILNEIIVISFFGILAWAGFYVLSIFGDETLTSLSFISQAMAQSALPVGCVLFIIAEIISIPRAFKSILESKTQDDEEIEQALRNINNNIDIKITKEKLS